MTPIPRSEQLELTYELTYGEVFVPRSAGAQKVFDILNDVRYPSELRKRKEISGGALTKMAFRKEITMSEYYELMATKEAKRADLVTSAQFSGIPQDIPESTNMPVSPEQPAPWSATDILKTMPAVHEFDARELAAGEHLDRD